jgi:hypothetical protein
MTSLTGKKEICNFVGRSWVTVEKWIINLSFPARLMGGRWESDGDLITEWRRGLLNGANKTENAVKSNSKLTKRPRRLIRNPKTP